MSQVQPTALNLNHEQFSLRCVDHEACLRNTEQTLMKFDGFASAFHSYH